MSPQQPSGIATVMFTDVEASTDTTTRMGDLAAAPLFANHDRVIQEQVAAHGGRPVRSTGDGFLVLFDSARSAVACALGIQRELAALPDGLRVRIGLSAGEVRAGEGEAFGAAVNLGARVLERAGGGEILVTDTVRQLAGTMPDVRFRDRGRVALKGFPERHRLHAVTPAEGRRRPRRARRPAWAVAAIAAALAAGVTTLALALTRGGEDAVAPRPDNVAILDAGDGRVTGQVPVGVDPAALAVGAGSVFVSNLGDDTLSQIDPRSHHVVATLSAGIGVNGVGAGPSGVWVAENGRSRAQVIDPTFGTVARSVPTGGTALPGWSRPVAVTDADVWIASYAEVARMNPETGRVAARVPVGGTPSGMATGAGALWVSDDVDGTVMRIEADEVVATVAVGQSASGIAADAAGVWVPVPLENRVKRIDPATNAVTDTVRVADGPAAVALGAGAVWVTSRGGTVSRIDPRAADVTWTVRLGHSPQGIAIVDGAVWVAVQAAPPAVVPAEHDADVLTALRPQVLYGGTDPLHASNTPDVQYATCAFLYSYPDLPAPAGAQLQPELATDMPAVTDGGRTYTFHVRPGYRFSPPSNAPVTAAAFERALERGLHRRSASDAATLMGDIEGAAAYTAGRAQRIAGVTARGDTLTIRLTAPSHTLVARLASKRNCAVPPTTPISGSGVEAIPMAGPYYIAEYVPQRRLVLRRNPNYGGERPARMRAIDFDLDADPEDAVAAVEAGRVDYTPNVPVDRIASADERYGPRSAAARAGRQRYFGGTLPYLHVLALNTRRPLFASARMRRAVSAALDRRALAAHVPTPGPAGSPGRATNRFILPGGPGSREVPLGPDLPLARRLAGPRARHAVMVTCTFPGCLEHARVVRRNLAAIGIDVRVRTVPLNTLFPFPRGTWDITYGNWFGDTTDPSDFTGLFAPPSGIPARLQRRIDAAQRLSGDARADAFARIDAALARTGPVVPFAFQGTTDFFADRIGCQVEHPVYGISLGALCVRD